MSDDKILVRLLSRGFTILSQLIACFNAPKGVEDVMSFTSRNLERLITPDDPKIWQDTRLKRTVPLDTLTNLGVELHWMSMKLNTRINAYRKVMGYKTVDFEREAILYDIAVEEGEKNIDDRRA